MTLNDRQVDELVQRWRRLVVNQQEGVSYGFWLGSVLLALLISMAVIWSVWRSRQQLAQEARERHKVEQALALESKFRESLFQALPVPVFLRNDKGEVIKRNKRAKRMEARYAADLVLPAPQLQGAEGELALHEQVYSYAQLPLRLGPRHRQGILSPSPTSAPCASVPACCVRQSGACAPSPIRCPVWCCNSPCWGEPSPGWSL